MLRRCALLLTSLMLSAATPAAAPSAGTTTGAAAPAPAAPSEELELFKLDEEVVIDGKAAKASAAPTTAAGAALISGRLTPPRKLDGPNPEYTQAALDHEVEGAMAVECIVGADGHVRKCKALKTLPFMEGAVIDALEARTYAPAALDGKPIDVDYTFHLHFKLPQ